MFSKSTMKDEDIIEDNIKALIDALKNEFKQEINVLNDRIVHLEEKNRNLNINLNTFMKNNFAYLDAKINVNHSYLLNQWNPFMTSTIEKVKDDLIETMNSNLVKKVDDLAIQVSNLNKIVVYEGFVDDFLNYSNESIKIKKNIEYFDISDETIFFDKLNENQYKSPIRGHNFSINIEYLKLFPNLKKIYLTKMFAPEKILFAGHKNYSSFLFRNFNIIKNLKINETFEHTIFPGGSTTKGIFNFEEIKLSKEDEEIRNKQIDILKEYIQTNFPHIEII